MLGAPYPRSTTVAPRIPPAEESSLSDETKKVLASLPPLNLFKVLANAPASFRPFLELGGAILFKSEFDARKREIAILRVAHVTRSNYEWVQHVALARHAGVTNEEIEKIASDEVVTSLDAEGGCCAAWPKSSPGTSSSAMTLSPRSSSATATAARPS